MACCCGQVNGTIYRILKNTLTKSSGRQLHQHSHTVGPTMKAWTVDSYGSPLVLSEHFHRPVLKNPWDVLVKVHAASVNPIDTMLIEGYGSSTLNVFRRLTCSLNQGSEMPLVTGRDFSGVVIATGQAVPKSKFKSGDEVWGAGEAWKTGSHTEYLAVSSCLISHKPKSLSHVEAASMPYVAATCWAALRIFGCLSPESLPGKRVLVLGGSGGIGTFVIQLLKAWGAHVVTTCATDAVSLVLELGADVALDYKTHDPFKELQNTDSFDVIFDTTSDNPDKCLPLLRSYHNAQYITLCGPFLRNNNSLGLPAGLIKSGLTLGAENFKALQKGQTYRWALFTPSGQAMRTVAELVDQGRISPVVKAVYAFDEVPEAFNKVQSSGNRGKTVIDMNKCSSHSEERESNN